MCTVHDDAVMTSIITFIKSTSYLKRVSNGPIEACCIGAYLLEVTFHIPQYTLAMNNLIT